MNIKLTRPLAFYDLETTGLDVVKDKIVSIAITKIMPDRSIEKKYAIINPKIPIPKAASDVHGITDEMVKDKPTFKQIAKSLYDFLKDCDLAGYNINNFDNAMLQEEFFCQGIEYPSQDTKSLDACYIYKFFNKRDLSSALKFYCNEEMTNAHNAEADNDATYKIFSAQLDRYPELMGKTVEEIHKICDPNNRVDWQGKIVRDIDGDYAYNFGTSRGQKVKDNLKYAEWILSKDFPASLKLLLNKIMQKKTK